MIVGLVSDTHGLLRPEAVEALQGSDLIIHAGDVGKAAILDSLRAIAPVHAIRGNIDKGTLAAALPETALVKAGPAVIYVLHNLNDLDLDPAAAGIHVVVSGHSHKPAQFTRNGVFYINPGSSGPRRFTLPITVGRLDLSRLPWSAEIVPLAT